MELLTSTHIISADFRQAGWEGLCDHEWEKSFEGVEGLGGRWTYSLSLSPLAH
jgi:hypothetical protein